MTSSADGFLLLIHVFIFVYPTDGLEMAAAPLRRFANAFRHVDDDDDDDVQETGAVSVRGEGTELRRLGCSVVPYARTHPRP